jgi:hypothetical protein
MAKNTPPPTCPKCGKPKKFMLVRTGGRKFRCVECDLPDPVHEPETVGWPSGELGKKE